VVVGYFFFITKMEVRCGQVGLIGFEDLRVTTSEIQNMTFV